MLHTWLRFHQIQIYRILLTAAHAYNMSSFSYSQGHNLATPEAKNKAPALNV